jgi:hypothetical protein
MWTFRASPADEEVVESYRRRLQERHPDRRITRADAMRFMWNVASAILDEADPEEVEAA